MTSPLSLISLALLAAAVAHGQTQEGSGVRKRFPNLCGAHLLDTLSMVCEWNIGKRSHTGLLSEDQLFGRLGDNARWTELSPNDVTQPVDMTSLRRRVLQSLFSPHSQERRLFASGVRNKRTITAECCDKPCDMETLSMYC